MRGEAKSSSVHGLNCFPVGQRLTIIFVEAYKKIGQVLTMKLSVFANRYSFADMLKIVTVN